MPRVRRDDNGRIITGVPTGTGPEGPQAESGVAESELLQFSSPRDPATIAALLRTRA
ncbi:hypothetical protein [Streptomyces sp. NPDC048720]|uniref:hypothetical protein n=1 Tax=Streptomyces sp. NPDC048720 TaxID=3365588 RepID=UPI003723C953